MLAGRVEEERGKNKKRKTKKKKKRIENETRRGTGDDGIGAISRSTGNARGNEARPVAASGIVGYTNATIYIYCVVRGYSTPPPFAISDRRRMREREREKLREIQ